MPRTLITGANGQLGSEIRMICESQKRKDVLFTDIGELNITDPSQLERFIVKNDIGCVINCAGYTRVDRAEDEPQQAHDLNATAPLYLARLACEHQFLFIHISTDYVFDGRKTTPYVESDIPDPLSAYGQSKYRGEQNIVQLNPRAVIVRTSWLYSAFGKNFVKSMVQLGREKEKLFVVNDQTGSPTWAGDLARAILHIESAYDRRGTDMYHYSNEACITWYDFAKKIFELKSIDCKVIPTSTQEFGARAPRPEYSVMSKEKIKNDFQIEVPLWDVSLEKCLSFIE